MIENTKIPNMETIKATAKLLGLPEHFIRQKVISGEIVSVKAGRKYLVNVDKLVEYLNTHTESATEQEEQAAALYGIRPVPVEL